MLLFEICAIIFICLAFFTMGVIIGLNARRENLPKIHMPKQVMKDATTLLEERIAQLKETQQMKIGIMPRGIYTREMV